MNKATQTRLAQQMKDYGVSALSEKTKLSRGTLYNLMNGLNVESSTLAKVFGVLNFADVNTFKKDPSMSEVYDVLVKYGAPLLADGKKSKDVSVEVATVMALKASVRDGLLNSVMPFFLLKNFKKINRVKLLSLLDDESQFQLLGYYLELAAKYARDTTLNGFADMFYRSDFPAMEIGPQVQSKYRFAVMNLKKNSAADKWQVKTLDSEDDYFSRFEKWDQNVR